LTIDLFFWLGGFKQIIIIIGLQKYQYTGKKSKNELEYLDITATPNPVGLT